MRLAWVPLRASTCILLVLRAVPYGLKIIPVRTLEYHGGVLLYFFRVRRPSVTCQRCGEETKSYTMSRFNTQNLCMSCLEKEKKHLQYKEAEAAELRAARAGDYSFPGIGKPADL